MDIETNDMFWMPEITFWEDDPYFASRSKYFVDDLTIGDNSVKTYRRALRCFTRWLEEEHGISPCDIDIGLYREHLVATKAPSTVSLYLSVVRKFIHYLEAKDRLYEGVYSMGNPPSEKPPSLDEASIQAALNTFDGTTLEGKRNRAIFALRSHAGLTAEEITGIKRHDFHTVRGDDIFLYLEKHHGYYRFQRVKIPPSDIELVKDYLLERKNVEGRIPCRETLFISLSDRNFGQRMGRRSVDRICKRARGSSRTSPFRFSNPCLKEGTNYETGRFIREIIR